MIRTILLSFAALIALSGSASSAVLCAQDYTPREHHPYIWGHCDRAWNEPTVRVEPDRGNYLAVSGHLIASEADGSFEVPQSLWRDK